MSKLDTVPFFRDTSISSCDKLCRGGTYVLSGCPGTLQQLKSILRKQKVSVVGELRHFQQSLLTHKLSPFPGSFPPRKAAQELQPSGNTLFHCCAAGDTALAGALAPCPKEDLGVPCLQQPALPISPAHPRDVTCRSPTQGRGGVPRSTHRREAALGCPG